MPDRGSGAEIGAELRAGFRAALLGAADRLDPLLEQARSGPPEPTTCPGCVVCALAAVLRGERTELSIRLAEHATGALAVLRSALAEDRPPPAEPPRPAGPRVQRIPVDR